ncbi:DNA, complete sequence [Bacillus sp. GeD10]|nr:DNA, complete sequence [Bacillus sp. GeD10]
MEVSFSMNIMSHKLRWYSKTGTQYRDKLFYIRGVSDEKTV